MSFSAAILAERLAGLERSATPPQRYVIALSGGLDSSVLAHALAESSKRPLLAIHVDHGLQPQCASWREHCKTFALELGIEFICLRIQVPTDSGKGPEASAREARYSALQAEMKNGDWLLSAHHRQDQAETILLNLIRGSGPAGLAGIGEIRRLAPGWLARPMLNVSRCEVQQYANKKKLEWLEDPSNLQQCFDRNFIRHEILPRLQARWPNIVAGLERSAGHAAHASQLLLELAAIDLASMGSHDTRLPIDKLSALSAARQRNVIRFALRELGLSIPTSSQLERILSDVIRARADAQPLVCWPGASVRRYRNSLYLLPERLADALEATTLSGTQLRLGAGLGMIRFEPNAELGISPELFRRGIRVSSRVGGEKILLEYQSHTKKLKKLLQESAVVPWMRDRLPLIYAGDQLVAVGDLWLAADSVSRPGVAVRWIDRPALH